MSSDEARRLRPRGDWGTDEMGEGDSTRRGLVSATSSDGEILVRPAEELDEGFCETSREVGIEDG